MYSGLSSFLNERMLRLAWTVLVDRKEALIEYQNLVKFVMERKTMKPFLNSNTASCGINTSDLSTFFKRLHIDKFTLSESRILHFINRAALFAFGLVCRYFHSLREEIQRNTFDLKYAL